MPHPLSATSITKPRSTISSFTRDARYSPIGAETVTFIASASWLFATSSAITAETRSYSLTPSLSTVSRDIFILYFGGAGLAAIACFFMGMWKAPDLRLSCSSPGPRRRLRRFESDRALLFFRQRFSPCFPALAADACEVLREISLFHGALDYHSGYGLRGNEESCSENVTGWSLAHHAAGTLRADPGARRDPADPRESES